MEISIVIKMQQVNFETSMKNIPLGGKKEYVMQLTKSVRKVLAKSTFSSDAGDDIIRIWSRMILTLQN